MIDLNEVRKRARHLPAMIQIGKKGLTPTLVEEIKRQLQRKKIIKVKILKSAKESTEKSAIVKFIVKGANAILVDQMGSTVILLKKE